MITEFSVLPDLIQHKPQKNRLRGKGKDHEPLWIFPFEFKLAWKARVENHGFAYTKRNSAAQILLYADGWETERKVPRSTLWSPERDNIERFSSVCFVRRWRGSVIIE